MCHSEYTSTSKISFLRTSQSPEGIPLPDDNPVTQHSLVGELKVKSVDPTWVPTTSNGQRKPVMVQGYYMDVSKNSGTPRSSILIGFSIINHPFWGTPIFGNTHIGTFIKIQVEG